MPIPHKVVCLDTPPEQSLPSIGNVIRNLVNLKEDRCNGADSNNGSASSEEILIDAEVDGERYLLVRMPKAGNNCFQLSPREQEIVRMVAKGHPNKIIADVLNISPWTVCTHLRRIFAKMGVASRAAMVARFPGIANSLSGSQLTAAMRRETEAQSSRSRGGPASAAADSVVTLVL